MDTCRSPRSRQAPGEIQAACSSYRGRPSLSITAPRSFCVTHILPTARWFAGHHPLETYCEENVLTVKTPDHRSPTVSRQ
jgi:hypothetical protein